MYRVKIFDGPNDPTGITIHSPYPNSNKLLAGMVKQMLSSVDLMNFTIHPKNKGWGRINPLKTLVKVENIKTRKTEFEGRVLIPKQTMSNSGLFSIEYECESFLAYLLDSIQDHGEFHDKTIREFLEILIDVHNPQVEVHKRFKVGVVNVTNSTDNVYRYTGYDTTYATIKDKLIDRFGGYLRVRNEPDGLYLDYLQDVGELSSTVIDPRKNMKDMSRQIDPTQVVTRLIPLGAQIESEDETATDASKARITIASVNGGKRYIDDPALIAQFGIKPGTLVLDDVNQPNILLTRGNQFFNNQKASQNSFVLNVLDLSLIGIDKDSIVCGDKYLTNNEVFAIKEPLQVIQKDLNIVNPVDVKVTIGDKFKTLTQYQVEANKSIRNFNDVRRTVENQSITIGSLRKTITDVNTTVERINVEINESNIPGLKQAVEDLQDVVDQLNISIGDIPVYGPVTATESGLMIPQDKLKLDNLEEYQLATGTIDGLMSKEDKQKLNRITANQAIDLDQFMADFLALKEVVENTTAE